MIAGFLTAFHTGIFAPTFIILSLIPLTICTLFTRRRVPFLLATSLLLFCSANLSLKTFLSPEHTTADIAMQISEERAVVEGVIDSRPEETETGWRIPLQAEYIINDNSKYKVKGRMLLSVKNGGIGLVTGDRIRFISRIRKPRNYGIPGEFDVERFMAFRGIFTTAFVENSDDVIMIGNSGQYRLQRQVDLIAMNLGKFISSNISLPEAAILRALLLGDMGGIPKKLKDAYTRAGVNHILSISGFHVGIIAIFVFQIVLLAAKSSEFLLLRINMRRASLFSTVPILIFYLFLSGAAPATIRSVIMIVVYIFAIAVEREVDPIDSLLLAAVIILAFAPPALFDLSFQLSFLAIWGIVTLTPIIANPFNKMQGKVAYKLLLFFFTSVAATAATIIPVAYYFHRTSAIGLISNFIIVPLLGYGAVVIGFSALPFVYLSPFIAKLFLMTGALLVKMSNNIIIYLAKLPMLPIFNPTELELCISYLFLVAVTFLKVGKIKRGCCLTLALFYTASSMMHASPDRGKLVLTFLSVGQGESILINFPEGKRMLLDGGGTPGESRWDVGERLVAPALWKMGIDSIDYLVLSHPHPDHIQGLKYIAENFRIGEFWDGGCYPEIDEYRELMEILKRRHIPIRIINSASAPINIGNVRVEPLAPFADTSTAGANHSRDLNDESMVLRIKTGNFSTLFTGDIGKETESVLLRNPVPLRCTILKLPHHGSRNSSSPEFLKAASPLIAVVSAGYGNGYHLPSEETLHRLKAMGIRLYRTDLDGTVQAVFDTKNDTPLIIRKIGHFR